MVAGAIDERGDRLELVVVGYSDEVPALSREQSGIKQQVQTNPADKWEIAYQGLGEP